MGVVSRLRMLQTRQERFNLEVLGSEVCVGAASFHTRPWDSLRLEPWEVTGTELIPQCPWHFWPPTKMQNLDYPKMRGTHTFYFKPRCLGQNEDSVKPPLASWCHAASAAPEASLLSPSALFLGCISFSWALRLPMM